MPVVTITYEKPEELAQIKDLADNLHLGIELGKEKSREERLKEILVPRDPSVDLSELSQIITDLNLNAEELRKNAWERKR